MTPSLTPTIAWRRMRGLLWPVDSRTNGHPLRPNPNIGCDRALERALMRILSREDRQTSSQLREALANQERPIHVGDAKLRETIAHLVLAHHLPIVSDGRGFGYAAGESELDAEIAELSSRIRALEERREAIQAVKRIYLHGDAAPLIGRLGPDGETAATPGMRKVRRRRRKLERQMAGAAKTRAPGKDALETEISHRAAEALARRGMTLDDIKVPF